MIAEESCEYHNREFCSSSTTFSFFLHCIKPIIWEKIQECSQTNEMGHMVECFEVEDRENLMKRYAFNIPIVVLVFFGSASFS